MTGLSKRQREVLKGEPAEEEPPGKAEGQGGASSLLTEPALLTPPGGMRGAHWRPPRKAVLGAVGLLVAVLAVLGARAWWADRQATASRPVAAGQGSDAGGDVARRAPGTPAGRGRTTAAGASRGAAGPGAAVPGATSPSQLLVHVVGRVARPGVVRLPAGARVQDAVTAAGGALPGADLSRVNLARPAGDGEQVAVPAVGEAAPPAAPAAAPGAAPSAPTGSAGPVNINTAGVTELDALPGIGPALAQRIVEHRDTNGPFRSVEDLDAVSGIGPALLARLRKRCVV